MKQSIDFLIDVSNNMEGRMAVAKEVLKQELIPALRDSDNFGVRTFLSLFGSPVIINTFDMGANSKSEFIEKVESLPEPNQGTPLSGVVKASLKDFQNISDSKKIIVLVTAGEETDGSDYAFDVQAEAPKDVQINIVGIGMTNDGLAKAQKVASLTGGVSVNIPESDYNNSFAIQRAVASIVEILQGKAVANVEVKEEAKPEVKEEVKVEEVKAEVKVEPQPVVETKPLVGEKPVEKTEKKEKPVKTKKSEKVNLDEFKTKSVKVEIPDVPTDFKSVDNATLTNEMESTNAKIAELLKSNISTLTKALEAQGGAQNEIAELKEAQKKQTNTINELQEAIADAQVNIDKLKSIVADKEEEIEALNSNKEDLMVTIQQWQDRDRNVIIDLDAKEREATSRASEQILYDFLEKKYPGRVKWCNQTNKATKGYDFEITGYENKETEYFIACKGAKDDRKIFFLSEEEWDACLNNSLNYQVYLVRDVANTPKIILIDNLIGWITCGKVRPCAEKNEKVKAGHVMLTLV